MNEVTNAVISYWASSRKVKVSQAGWISGNAPCCIHNNETPDTRGRGGLIVGADDSLSWNCFNCNFKASYQSGKQLNYKFRKLLSWMGMAEGDIYRLVFESIKERDKMKILGLVIPETKIQTENIEFTKFILPENSLTIAEHAELVSLGKLEITEDFEKAVSYICSRKIDLSRYSLCYSPEYRNRINKRVIVPFTWNNEIIGYTARLFSDSLVGAKYYSEIDSGYVFNIDNQGKDWQLVIVMEGPFDAMSIDGVAVMHSDISQQQIDIIESLDREVIVVPDNDTAGENLIQVALDRGWSVSFPVWSQTCKDVNEAIVKYGKVFVLKTILDGVEHNRIKIKIMAKNTKRPRDDR